MATMRPRGSGTSARRRSGGGGAVRPVYEEFKPMSEWKQDDDSHILSVDLPGFMKEQINVTTRGENTIIVDGKRFVAGNKWSNFHEEFQAPGEMNSLQVDFQGGTLYIRIPKEEAEKSKEYSEPISLESIQDPLPTSPTDQTKVSSLINAQEATNEKSWYARENYDALQEQEQEQDQDRDEAAEETVEKEENYEDEGSHWEKPNDETMLVEDRTPDILENIVNNEQLYVGKTKAKKYKTVEEENGELINERKLKMNIKVAMLIIVAIIGYCKYKFASLGGDYRD